jgi:hypothetical protein
MFIAVSLIFSGCNKQGSAIVNDSENTESNFMSGNQPQEDIQVNKTYDKDGNLIRYDSIYSYYYHSKIRNIRAFDDVVSKTILKIVEDHYPPISKPYFDKLFLKDSLLQLNYFKRDALQERFTRHRQQMDRIIRENDSIKNKFTMTFLYKDYKI